MEALPNGSGDTGLAWSVTLLPLGLFWLALLARGRRDHILRAAAAAVGIILTLRYVVWRALHTLPSDQGPAAGAWAMLFLGMELLVQLGSVLNLAVLSRTRSRGPESDALAMHPLRHAATDVMIATYNEPRDVLERTILGARDLRHPDLRIWVLDDGARDWVRDLAAELGVLYTRRHKGAHAKAGNVNHGLGVALAAGRPPRFVLLLDADFVPSREILERTLPLFASADVGVVQTPQRFFNPDPIQVNVLSPSVWPDEQSFFFRVLMPSLDAWGGAFCCGTSAVLRVEALLAVGGMATETVTEDMLTSFKLVEAGWRTIYLDEPLSLGLAPEGVAEYTVQRGRWCLGAVQQLHTRWSFAGRARLRLINRVNHLSTALYWLISFPFRIMVLAAPAVWWWTGASVIDARPDDLVRFMLPAITASIVFIAVYSGNRQLPILFDVSQLVPTMDLARSIVAGLLRPRGQTFRVTPKGRNTQRHTVHWRLLSPFLALAGITVTGLVANLPSNSALRGSSGYVLTVFWSLLSLVIALLTCLACVDQPRRRKDERFASGERAVALAPGRKQTPCTVRDISVGGACLIRPGGWPMMPAHGRLWLDDGALEVPFATIRTFGDQLAVRFEPTPPIRAALILKLFDPRYRPDLEYVDLSRAFATAIGRLFA